MAFTVGKVSEMFGLSRTTLLYYDKIGLLRPEARSPSGYRLYSDKDITRLKQIITLKDAGVPIRQIGRLIAAEETSASGKLMKRLGELNLEIEQLKNFQKRIIRLLSDTELVKSIRSSGGEAINVLVGYAEISPDQRERWHSEFEAQSPELHEYFLSVLGLDERERKELKKRLK